MESIVTDASLAEEGHRLFEWTATRMPILREIKSRFSDSAPFEGIRIGICLHVEPKTSVWIETLRSMGAEISITGSPGTTVDATAAFLAGRDGVRVFARNDESFEDHLGFCKKVLEFQPNLISDNGADLHELLNKDFVDLKKSLIGATEETTSGGYRLREDLAATGFPTIVINDSNAKRLIENRYGVGLSVVEAIMSSTNLLVGGLKVAVIGYGYCGRGVALCFKNLGARVSVIEIDPLTKLDALLEGFDVCSKEEGLSKADLIVTVTGRDGTFTQDDIALVKDGVVLANAGHFEFEIDVVGLKDSSDVSSQKEHIERLDFKSGKTLYLLGKGRPINLSAGNGNPIEVMDLGLALQTLSLKYLVEKRKYLDSGPQNVPSEVEREVSEMAFEVWK